MSIGYRLPNSSEVGWFGSSTERFDLADAVGFQFGLRVQPLYGRCTKCGSGNGGDHDLGLCIHDKFPRIWLKQTVRPLAEARAILRLANAGDARPKKEA